jgi:cupin fold WbuC family metalloprotein
MPTKLKEIVNPDDGTVSHIVIQLEILPGDTSRRNDIVNPVESLQCAVIEMSENQTFEPHVHSIKTASKSTSNTQEAWVIIKGQVEATLYNARGDVIENVLLNPGDACITLRGGHNYTAKVDGTVVYEFKTGPYLGPEIDKTMVSTLNKRAKD